jgi:hypothetical protein
MDPDKQAVNASAARFFHWKLGAGRCESRLDIEFDDGSVITVQSSIAVTPYEPLGELQSRALAAAAAALEAAAKLGEAGIAARLSPDWSVTGDGA